MPSELVWAYYRFWNIPEIEGLTNKDHWLTIPVTINSTPTGNHITAQHIDAVTRSLMLIRQTGQLLKIERTLPGKTVKPDLLRAVANSAFNVADYQEWPWRDMFDQKKVHERFKRRFGQNNNIMFYRSIPDDPVYRAILATYQTSKPCGSCGRK